MIENIVKFLQDISFIVAFIGWAGYCISGFILSLSKSAIENRSIWNMPSFFLSSLTLRKDWYKSRRIRPLIIEHYKFVLYRTISISLFLFSLILGIGFSTGYIINTFIILHSINLLNLLRLSMRKEFKWSFLSITNWILIFIIPIVYSASLVRYYQYEFGGFYLKKYKKKKIKSK